MGCSYSNLEEVQREADYNIEQIVLELGRVVKKEDLKKIVPSLSVKFEKLVREHQEIRRPLQSCVNK